MAITSQFCSTLLLKESIFTNRGSSKACACSYHSSLYRQEIPSQVLGENLRRIFVERGIDFFDKNNGQLLEQGILRTDAVEDVVPDPDATATEGQEEPSSAIMTTEELFKMRMEILPQLL